MLEKLADTDASLDSQYSHLENVHEHGSLNRIDYNPITNYTNKHCYLAGAVLN